jgi:hypothetical protein
MNRNVLEIEDELVATEGLSQAAVVTDLPNAPPQKKPFLDAEDHTDIPAVDVDIDIDIDIDIVFVDIDIDIDIDIDTPHVDTN